MKRREFIVGLAGTAVAPLAARGQQRERLRRVGVLMNFAADDLEAQARLGALLQGLQERGWSIGRNVRIEGHYGALDSERVRKATAEILAVPPDVIVANGPPVVTALQQATQTVPVVFCAVTDPVALGVVQSLARPGGNITGFTPAEFSLSAKWPELLKELAPGVKRVGVFREPTNPGSMPQFAAVQTAAPSLGMDVRPLSARNPQEIERDIAALAQSPDAGLIVARISETIVRQDLIIELAARYRLPAVYPLRLFAANGGLVSYGTDIVDEYRRAADYVDRILKGEKPADLPVQVATKYELVVNLKTAKALGLTVPPSLLARADEVIE
jgi:putative ABC transport system substrate-binding protein